MNITSENIDDFKILEIITGSNLYGTNTPSSDLDYGGIFIAPKDYYLGLKKIEQFDRSVVSKLESGKNSKDAVDFTMYELRKFITLAIDNNPNITEYLFTPQDKVVYSNSFGDLLLQNAQMFPYKGLKDKFLGYAFSQKHKMIIKVDNYEGLKIALDWLQEQCGITDPNFACVGLQDKTRHKRLLAEFRDTAPKSFKYDHHNVVIGDLSISIKDTLYKTFLKVRDRLSKVGNREELYTKYGFDTKFGMHLVRLMLEGRELLETGKLEYPLKDRQMLLDIRSGKWTKEDVIAYSEQLEAEMDGVAEKSSLPSKPRYKEVEELLMSMVEEWWAR